jgi:predicted transcriptional regulator
MRFPEVLVGRSVQKEEKEDKAIARGMPAAEPGLVGF